tara:strand:+ start:1427 stop:1918 length:492 start_codon:yes stop_codon:yes gene_type:complete
MKTQFVYMFFLGIFSFHCNSQNTSAAFSPLKVIQYKDSVKGPFSNFEMQQLLEVYGSHLDKEILSRPNRVLAMKNLLRNRIVIQENSSSINQKKHTLLSEVPLFDAFVSTNQRDLVFDSQTFNPLKYRFSFYSRGSHTYHVDGTNYSIVVRSQHQNIINQSNR